jgi:Holliday junction resolvase RusA-like endonuclease
MACWTLPYPHGTINHLYERHGQFWEPAAWYARFRDEVVLIVRLNPQPIPEGWLMFRMFACVPDRRARDLDNLLKPAIDAVRLALDFDDARIAEIIATKSLASTRPCLDVRLEASPWQPWDLEETSPSRARSRPAKAPSSSASTARQVASSSGATIGRTGASTPSPCPKI